MADLVTIAEVKVEAGISGTQDDVLLTALLSAVLSLWDKLTGRTWLSASYTEYHDSERGSAMIFLKHFPVTAVASLYDDPNWSYGADTLIDTDYYKTDMEAGVIHYLSKFNVGKQNIKVTYTAGYTSVTVPAWLKELIIRQVAVWHQQAANKRWPVSSISSKEGTVISFSVLKNNLLPEFIAMAEKEARFF